VNTPTTVIIGDHTQGLGIARSAAMAGAPVWIVNDKCISLARFSRYLTGYKQLRRATLSQLARTECAIHLRETLLELPVEGPAALFGVNEDITWFIHRNRAALRTKYSIPEVPFERIYDKFAFNRLLPEAVRLDTRLCSETDLSAVDHPQCFILKGRFANAFRQTTGQKAIRLHQITPHERNDLFAKLAPDQVVLQKIIETCRPVVSVCSFSVEGQVAAHFGYEKLRQHPNRFGTGTYLRSTFVDELAQVAERILESLSFTGISEIEFIHDPESDTHRVIEMNPRTWKSIHFSTQCGQNLVASYLSHVADSQIVSRNSYVKNRYWADLATDIPQMFRERKIWGYHRGFFECTWDRSDPLPAFVLWTLFPLIAIENSLAQLTAHRSVRLQVQHPQPPPAIVAPDKGPGVILEKNDLVSDTQRSIGGRGLID
jgi:predicted ATP-grasp superfamily ATP-dependent carboligase